MEGGGLARRAVWVAISGLHPPHRGGEPGVPQAQVPHLAPGPPSWGGEGRGGGWRQAPRRVSMGKVCSKPWKQRGGVPPL